MNSTILYWFNPRHATLIPMITTTFVAASAKFAQLIPLLVQWNSASCPQNNFLRCYSIGELLAPRERRDKSGRYLYWLCLLQWS